MHEIHDGVGKATHLHSLAALQQVNDSRSLGALAGRNIGFYSAPNVQEGCGPGNPVPVGGLGRHFWHNWRGARRLHRELFKLLHKWKHDDRWLLGGVPLFCKNSSRASGLACRQLTNMLSYHSCCSSIARTKFGSLAGVAHVKMGSEKANADGRAERPSPHIGLLVPIKLCKLLRRRAGVSESSAPSGESGYAEISACNILAQLSFCCLTSSALQVERAPCKRVQQPYSSRQNLASPRGAQRHVALGQVATGSHGSRDAAPAPPFPRWPCTS